MHPTQKTIDMLRNAVERINKLTRTTRKQFEDEIFNPPLARKVTKKRAVDKHTPGGQGHDQDSHGRRGDTDNVDLGRGNSIPEDLLDHLKSLKSEGHSYKSLVDEVTENNPQGRKWYEDKYDGNSFNLRQDLESVMEDDDEKVAKDVQEPTNQVTLPGADKTQYQKRGSVKPKGNKIRKRPVSKHTPGGQSHDQSSHDPTRGRGGRKGKESSPKFRQAIADSYNRALNHAQDRHEKGENVTNQMTDIEEGMKQSHNKGDISTEQWAGLRGRFEGMKANQVYQQFDERDKRRKKVTKNNLIKHPGHPDQSVHGRRGVYARAAGAGAAGAVAGRALAPAVRGLAATAAAGRAVSALSRTVQRINPKGVKKFKRLKRRATRALRRHTAKLGRAIAPAAKAGLRLASRVRVPGAIGIGLMAAAAGLGLIAQRTLKMQKAGGLTVGDHVLVLTGDEAIVGVYAGNGTVRVLTNDSYVDTKPPKADVLLIERGNTVPNENSSSDEIATLADTLSREKKVMENLSAKVKNEKVSKRDVSKHGSHDQSTHGRRGANAPAVRPIYEKSRTELQQEISGLRQTLTGSLPKSAREDLERRLGQYRRALRSGKVTKRSKVDKHAMGQHDQKTHGNRATRAVRAVRAKARRVGRRVTSGIRQAGRTIEATTQTTRQVADDLDAVLQGLEAGTRIYDKVNSLKDSLLGESEKMAKAEMSDKELDESKRLAERLKGKKDIDNPHALARWQVQQKLTKLDQLVGSLLKAPKTPKRRSSPSFMIKPGVLGAYRPMPPSTPVKYKPSAADRISGAASRGLRHVARRTTHEIARRGGFGTGGKGNPVKLPKQKFDKVAQAFEKGIGHSLRTLTNALDLIREQEADKKISEADEKRLQEIIREIRSMVGYLEEVKEQGFFEKVVEKHGSHDQSTHGKPKGSARDLPNVTSGSLEEERALSEGDYNVPGTRDAIADAGRRAAKARQSGDEATARFHTRHASDMSALDKDPKAAKEVFNQAYRDESKKRRKVSKGEAHVPDSSTTYRPSFTTPAVADHLKRQGIKPNAKGRGTSTAREPGY